MKLQTRTTLFLLTALLTASSFLSCSDSGSTSAVDTTASVDDVQTTAPVEEVTADLYEGLEAKDLGGDIFHVVGQNTTSRQNFWFEDLEGNIVNDAIHDRDRAVEERLNIKLEFTSHEDRQEAASMLQRAVNAGDETYDMIITALSQGINTLTTGEMLFDLREIPHLTLDSIYWNKSMYENMHFF